MGLFSGIRLASAIPRRGGQSASPFTHGVVSSPWGSSGSLARTMVSDIFGSEFIPPSRLDAMRVPAIAKGRGLICGTLSRQPLTVFAGEANTGPAEWMFRSDAQPLVSPTHRMLWTLDDLIFEGRSLWWAVREDGLLVDAWRVPIEEWELTDDLQILVQGDAVSEDQVIYFEGPQDGLLEIARDDIKAARAMTRAWANRVEAPVPVVELHLTDDLEPTDEEADELIATWESQRRKGGTALTPKNIEVKTHGNTPTDLFIAGRNAGRLDIANFLNLPGSILDGSTATASLTYTNNRDSRSELVDISLQYWAAPIAARLSLDDVVPRGQRVDFDISWLAQSSAPTSGPASED